MKIKRYLIPTLILIFLMAVMSFISAKCLFTTNIRDRFNLNKDVEMLYGNNEIISLSNVSLIYQYNQPSKEAFFKWNDDRQAKIKELERKGEDIFPLVAQYDFNKTMPEENKQLALISENAENIVKVKLTGNVIVPQYFNYFMYEVEIIKEYEGEAVSKDNKILLMHPISFDSKNKQLRSDNMSVPLKMDKEYVMFLKRYQYHETQVDEVKNMYVTYCGGFSCYEISDTVQKELARKGEMRRYEDVKEEQIFCYTPEDIEIYNSNKKEILKQYI